MAVRFSDGGEGFRGRAPHPTPAQLAARRADRDTVERARERKRDSRRKIVAGAALLDLARRDDAAARVLDRILRELERPQDRELFKDRPIAP